MEFPSLTAALPWVRDFRADWLLAALGSMRADQVFGKVGGVPGDPVGWLLLETDDDVAVVRPAS